MKRGEVWWANVSRPVGRRPVLLLSRDAAYLFRQSVTVAPITRTVHNIPAEVSLGRADGLPTECVVNLDNLMTIPKRDLERLLATLQPAKMELVEQAIKFALALR